MQLKKATENSDVPEMLSPLPGMDLAATPPPKSGSALDTACTAFALVCTLVSVVMIGLVTWMIYANLSLVQDL